MSPTSSSSSSASYTQSRRTFRFDSPAGKDALLVSSFVVEEEMSRPFRIDIELLSERTDVDPLKMIGEPASIAVDLVGGGTRHFHGIISRFAQGERENGFTSYRVEIVPRLWLLSQRRDNRIFQQLSVPDILKEVLAGLDVHWSLIKPHPRREYCVQYGETDLAFASRLMEDEGIYYFFDYTADKHTMFVVDDTSAVKPVPDLKGLRVDTSLADAYEENVVFRVQREHAVRSGKFTLSDYSFEKPSSKLRTELQSQRNTKLEVYEYPGGFAEPDEGERLTRIRLEELESMQETLTGSSNVRSLRPGFKLTLTDHYRRDVNAPYQLLRVRHEASTDRYRTDGAGDRYSNEFLATPVRVPFRPARVTPRPTILGSQTAVVVGKSGEEIWVDKYGRVKVHFHWDRQGKRDENSSCWVRVASTWAGKQWGFVQIPRIGQEVIVDFLEGDPDQPIITGRVYNAENMPPWALPGEQAVSGLRTRSTKGGGAANCNELAFDDRKGSERVFLHAEKDHVVEVESDERISVGHDRTKSVGNDESTSVGRDRAETVGRDESVSIGKNRTEQVGENETVAIGKSRSVAIGENDEQTVGQNHRLTVGENQAIDLGKDNAVKIGGSRTTDVGKDDALKVGKSITVDAGSQLVLKCGAAKIVLKQDGTVQIQGVQVSVSGSGTLSLKSDGQGELKASKLSVEGAAMAEVKSTGILTVKGSMVMIN